MLTLIVNRIYAFYRNLKDSVIGVLRATGQGNRMYFFIRRSLGYRAKVDYNSPNLISLELSSSCNLSCIHCPSHSRESRERQFRNYGFMDYALFELLMDEIDQHGPRRLMLHKDGEPLLNSKISEMLERLKIKREHHVYLSTNGILLDEKLSRKIIGSRIRPCECEHRGKFRQYVPND